MKPFLHIISFLFIIVLATSSFAVAKCLDDKARALLWEEAKSQLAPRLLYTIPEFTIANDGQIVSSESHYYKVAARLSKSPADIHIGFGTLLNFNLIGARPGPKGEGGELDRTAVFADRSYEVVVAMMSFWKPIWLAADTPQQWLAFATDLPFEPEENIGSLFEKIRTTPRAIHQSNKMPVMTAWYKSEMRPIKVPDSTSKSDKEGLRNPQFESKLNELLAENRITPFDKKFALLLLEQERLGCSSIFSNATRGEDIGTHLTALYDLYVARELSTQTGIRPDAFIRRVSFLHNETVFKRVKRMFEAKKDFYAIASLEDVRFWTSIGEWADIKGQKVTDIYVSCIPESERTQDGKKFDRKAKSLLTNLPRSKTENSIFWYESECSPKNFTVRRY